MTSETLLGASTTVGAMLGGAGVSVVAVESLRRRRLRSSALVRRWITWTVLAAMWLVGLSHAAAMFVVLAAIGVLSALEYSRLAGLAGVDVAVLLVSPIAALSALAAGLDLAVILSLAGLSATVAPLLAQDVAHGPRRIGRVLVGMLMAVVPIAVIWVMQTMSPVLVLTLLIGVALSDVTAYVAGSALGNRKLVPVLSPNKTWSGAAGNLTGAAIGVTVAATVAPIDIVPAVVIVLVLAVGSVWGDLLESLLKRHAGVKDAGSVLPGFGGVLDRFDSLVVAAPLLLGAVGVFGGLP